jgi:hypothetical protein
MHRVGHLNELKAVFIYSHGLSFIQIAGTDHLFSILILKADLGQVCLFDNFGRIPKLSDPGP